MIFGKAKEKRIFFKLSKIQDITPSLIRHMNEIEISELKHTNHSIKTL